jgi:Helix-turn-helix domain
MGHALARLYVPDQSQIAHDISGWSMDPMWVKAIPGSYLSTTAKTLLSAIIGFCTGQDRNEYPSVNDMAAAIGEKKCKTERALAELKEFDLVDFAPDRTRKGHPYKMALRFDPRKGCPDHLIDRRDRGWARDPTSAGAGPHQRRRGTPPAPARDHTSAGAGPLALCSIAGAIEIKDREIQTTTDASSSSSNSSFDAIIDPPEPTEPSGPIADLRARYEELFPEVQGWLFPVDEQVRVHGAEKVELALNEAAIAKADPKRRSPERFTYVGAVLSKWANENRPVQSIRAGQKSTPKMPTIAAAIRHSSSKLEAVGLEEREGQKGFFEAWHKEGRCSVFELLDVPATPEKEKPAAGSRQRTPRSRPGALV